MMNVLKTLLNEEQLKTVQDVLAAGEVEAEALQALIEDDQLTDEDKTKTLIEKLIVPYRSRAIEADIRERLANGEHQIVGVGSDGENPPFAYSIGGIDKIGAELLVVANIDLGALGSILNVAMDAFEKAGTHTQDIGQIGTLAKTGEALRYRILPRMLSENVGDFLRMVPDFYPEYPLETPVYVIELADGENLLPGEDGYNDDLIQYSHLTENHVSGYDVIGFVGKPGTGKTHELVKEAIKDIQNNDVQKAVFFLTEQNPDVVINAVVEHFGEGAADLLSCFEWVSLSLEDEPQVNIDKIYRTLLNQENFDSQLGWYLDELTLFAGGNSDTVKSLVKGLAVHGDVHYTKNLPLTLVEKGSDTVVEDVYQALEPEINRERHYVIHVE